MEEERSSIRSIRGEGVGLRSSDTLAIFLAFCVASSGLGNALVDRAKTNFNVVNFGAIGDGRSDDTDAFIRAWQAVCGCTGGGGTPTLIVPQGKTFLLQSVRFQGPCESTSVHVQVLGSLLAPNTLDAWRNYKGDSWLSFSKVGNLIIDGNGLINGRGSFWWRNEANHINERIFRKFYIITYMLQALRFHRCNNLQLSGLNHLDSPKNHISINGCNGATISNLHIMAPENSPNTDGIDISSSSHVNIQDCIIKTGDDCIALNNGTSFINITRVACGPGHGISVGSLGKNGAFDKVEEVHVLNCSFTGTQNGARIKTWQGGSGFARKITFEQITLSASENPIIIDQYYCNGGHNCPPARKPGVQISDVTFSDVRGTSASKQAISLNCDKKAGCTNIILNQINITSSIPGEQLVAACINANGSAFAATPSVPCLSKLFTN
ncbi:hypothetical protein L1049_012814 [Liquidambar formosana]|uniref:endo-polygalacturonase n=1 Tax=Liquidambar formosana TaxID=63359 RepID=A0AAP0RKY3_LIQFO